MSRTVAITGATGLIGRAVAQALLERGDRVIALVRRPPRNLPDSIEQRSWLASTPVANLRDADAVVHLAGVPIAEGRWTAERKRIIVDSRVRGTRSIVEGIRAAAPGVKVLVSASGIDLHGDTGPAKIDESTPPGTGFVADLTVRWEREAHEAESVGCRVVTLRSGMVLAREGGALPRLLPFFRLGLGGPLGSGRQYVAWIHLQDEVGLILHALDHPELSGPMIATSPRPVPNAILAEELGSRLHRPAMLRVPEFALRLGLGEMASVLLDSHNARPRRAIETGYRFRFEELKDALADLIP